MDFLCDHDVERSICERVGALPGYTTTSLRILGLSQAHDKGLVKQTTNARKAVILTKDRDYLDEVDFRICTHPGVLFLEHPSAPAEVIPRLEDFLKSSHFKVCRHAVVRLRGDVIYIQSEPGGALVEMRYRPEPSA